MSVLILRAISLVLKRSGKAVVMSAHKLFLFVIWKILPNFNFFLIYRCRLLNFYGLLFDFFRFILAILFGLSRTGLAALVLLVGNVGLAHIVDF